jgi:hypothetical protein
MDQESNRKFGEKRLHLLSWHLPYFAAAISSGQVWAAIANPRHEGQVQVFEAGYVTKNKYLKLNHCVFVSGHVHCTTIWVI